MSLLMRDEGEESKLMDVKRSTFGVNSFAESVLDMKPSGNNSFVLSGQLPIICVIIKKTNRT